MQHPIKKQLNDIAAILPGYPFRGTITPIPTAKTKVVQVRDISEYGDINVEQLITTEITGRKQPDYLTEGDILFVVKGAKHFATYIQQLPENCVCSPYFFIIRINPEQQNKVLPEFINWQLNQNPAQRYFKNSAEGTSYVSIRRKILEDTPITLPSITIQQRIVALHRASVNEHKVLQQLTDNRRQQIEVISHNLINT